MTSTRGTRSPLVHPRRRGRAGRRSWAFVGTLLAALSVGCASYTPAPPPPAGADAYLVGAPDQLAVTVLPEPAIVENAVVRPDGEITIQLIGDVQAAGRTPNEIAEEIEQRIGRFKRGARATVAVVSAQSTAVTVLGEVRAPSAFPLLKQTRVAEAIGATGGTTIFANLDEIRVLRSSGSDVRVIPVNLAAIRDGDLATNIVLAQGDIVYVPPSIFAKIGYAVQAVLFPIQPALGIANSTAGAAIVGN